MNCAYCAAPISAAPVGGQVRKFCGTRCRGLYHTVARKWGELIAATGAVSIAEMRRAVDAAEKAGSASGAACTADMDTELRERERA